MRLKDFGYVRIGTAVSPVDIGDPIRNSQWIAELIEEASKDHIEVLVFPELSITGYTCGELFNQELLLDKCFEGLRIIADATVNLDMLAVVGVPVRVANLLFNTAAVVHRGRILAFVPKSHLPNSREFYESRWFSRAQEVNEKTVSFFGEEVPIQANILFQDNSSDLKIAIEICEDLWVPNPPGIRHALRGANVLLNLSSSNELLGKRKERQSLVTMRSSSQICAYAYSSSGYEESTSDMVFSGHCLIAEDGDILYEDRFLDQGRLGFADIDVEKLQMERLKTKSFENFIDDYLVIPFQRGDVDVELKRSYSPKPFLPQENQKEEFRDLFRLQVLGYAQRMKRTGIQKSLIGVSGGLDSTWALLVTKAVHKMLGLPLENILAISMPGPGTSEQTLSNLSLLMKALDMPYREIDITESVLLHLRDMGIDPEDRSVVFENAQARERTQILMDLSNKVQGLVVGTGDLSEIALGWSTYNGDQMSMYNVNCSLTKTMIRAMMKDYADDCPEDLKKALHQVLGTPVSPELLPPDESGKIQQMTEEILGDYDINDFFLYHMIGVGFPPKKLLAISELAFPERKHKLLPMLKNFVRRFITMQFKRNAAPDGPKLTTVSLSSRGDFKMPADASYRLWLRELEELEHAED